MYSIQLNRRRILWIDSLRKGLVGSFAFLHPLKNEHQNILHLRLTLRKNRISIYTFKFKNDSPFCLKSLVILISL